MPKPDGCTLADIFAAIGGEADTREPWDGRWRCGSQNEPDPAALCERVTDGRPVVVIPYLDEDGRKIGERELHAAAPSVPTVPGIGDTRLFNQPVLPDTRPYEGETDLAGCYVIVARHELDAITIEACANRKAVAIPRDVAWDDAAFVPLLRDTARIIVSLERGNAEDARLLAALRSSKLAPQIHVWLFDAGDSWNAWRLRQPEDRDSNFETAVDLAIEAAKPLAQLPPQELQAASLAVSLRDLKAQPVSWLVPGFLNTGGLGFLIGPPGTWKSYFAILLVLCIAAARAFFGRPVPQGATLIVALEGRELLHDRIMAALVEHGLPRDLPVYVYAGELDLRDPKSVRAFRQACEELSISLVIIDTLSIALGDADEIRAADVAPALKACKLIQRELGTAILFLSHPTKSGNTGSVRGSGRFDIDADLIAVASETKTGGVVEVTKLRAGPKGAKFHFAVKQVGDNIALVPGAAGAAPAGHARARDLTGLQEKIFAALAKAAGRKHRISYPDGLEAVRRVMPGKTPGHQRESFDRALSALAGKGLVSTAGEEIEIISKGNAP